MPEWIKRLAEDSGMMALAIFAGLLVVWKRSDGHGCLMRVATMLASATLAIAVGADFASFAHLPESFAYVLVTVAGPLVLEILSDKIEDPVELIRLWKEWRKK